MKLDIKHINFARSRHFRASARFPLVGDLDYDLQSIFARAHALGITMREKECSRPWCRATTTIRKRWLLGKNFYDKPKFDQLRIGRHEYGHTLQQLRLGLVRFGALYLIEAWRWALETNCKMEDVYVCKQYKIDPTPYVEAYIEALPRLYKLDLDNEDIELTRSLLQ